MTIRPHPVPEDVAPHSITRTCDWVFPTFKVCTAVEAASSPSLSIERDLITLTSYSEASS